MWQSTVLWLALKAVRLWLLYRVDAPGWCGAYTLPHLFLPAIASTVECGQSLQVKVRGSEAQLVLGSH